MKNLAGTGDNETARAELEAAGIKVDYLPKSMPWGECKLTTVGQIGPWLFKRAWYYWIAEGPGIPPDIAEELHAKFGKVVRVDGHCGCPSPREWFGGFAVGHYHVDTQEGLNALADVIRSIMEKNK